MLGTLSLTGTSTADLGLGDKLATQATDETEEMRKKRMLMQQQARLTGSPAASSLFGAGGLGALS